MQVLEMNTLIILFKVRESNSLKSMHALFKGTSFSLNITSSLKGGNG